MKSVSLQKDISIDGEKYVVQLYSPTFGLTLYAKLLRLLGEPVVKLLGMYSKTKDASGGDLLDVDLANLDTDSIGEALQSLFLNLKDDQFAPLLKEILSETRFSPSLDPVSSRFEETFAGQYLHLFKLVAQTLGVQYADFLSVFAKRARAASAAAASRAVAQKIKTEKETATA